MFLAGNGRGRDRDGHRRAAGGKAVCMEDTHHCDSSEAERRERRERRERWEKRERREKRERKERRERRERRERYVS